jgi:outer membrane cobalamin receptor
MAVLVLMLSWCSGAWGAGGDDQVDETMLMFVGEDLTVVTAVSKRPEPAAEAPAIVSVVDRPTMESHGYKTLAELLATQPGWYINGGERGSTPYLRGVPDSGLFLYDGVPLSGDFTKSLPPLDRELSLRSVKRVEIVRGPASVLWGPDAFAGIVNVVPLTGKDHPGLHTGAFAGTEPYLGGFFNWGFSGAKWDAFLSGYGAKDRFWDDTFLDPRSIVTPEQLPQEDQIDDSHYLEFTGNAQVGDWLSISGRYAREKRRFTLRDTTVLSWQGERESPISYINATLAKDFGRWRVNLSGYYEYIEYDLTDADLEREQKNHIYNGELRLERSLGEQGHFTAGTSFRSNEVIGAVVRDGFLPEFISPGIIFVPDISQEDFTNDLFSLFGQYRHQWRGVDFWLGARYDDHSQYDSRVTYSLGLNWPVAQDWRLKADFGTAYRTPFSGQLFGDASFDPEGITTLNLQVSWSPTPGTVLQLTGFYSQLTDHVSEDPFGGLSAPTDQEFIGAEFMGRTRLFDQLDLYGNFTTFANWGDSEQYRVLLFSFVRPDGTRVDVFDEWEQPFNPGPDFIVNLGAKWDFHPRASLVIEGNRTSSVPFSFRRDAVSGSFSQDLLLDATLSIRDLVLKHSYLTLKGTNLLDQDYQVPGIFGPVEGKPFALYAEWSLRF